MVYLVCCLGCVFIAHLFFFEKKQGRGEPFKPLQICDTPLMYLLPLRPAQNPALYTLINMLALGVTDYRPVSGLF